MVELLASAADKMVVGITAAATFVGGLATVAGTLVVQPVRAPIASLPQSAQTAIAYEIIARPVMPDLLPSVVVRKTKLTAILTSKTTSTTSSAKATLVSAKITAAPSLLPPQTITAQWILANTTTSFVETHDGPYELMFTADSGTNVISWDLTKTTIGGTGAVPQFNAAYSCNPAPVLPDVHLADQNPQFAVKTPYSCTVSLTPLFGTDQRTQSRTFSLTTPAGELIITPAAAMNTVLVSGQNNGGIVFTNQDSSPVTIEGLTVDISYTALTTVEGPLVLRFIDPKTGQSLADYHMEALPETNSSTFAYGEANVTIPFTFTLGASKQQMLPVELLNVERMSIENDNPTVKIIVRSISTDRSDMETVLNEPTILWTCEVVLAPYDPNATSGPYASGQACTQ